jgi:hypothetical protein
MAIVGEQSYVPEFNIETQKYEDKCPIPPRAKGFIYRCKCTNTGFIFTSLSEFSIHRKNKTHKNYVDNYLERVKESSEYINIIKYNQIKIERLMRENAQLKKTLIEKERQFKFMNELD